VVAALQIIGREILRERREQLNLQHVQIAKQADGSASHDRKHV
jgi:hypothetical protein